METESEVEVGGKGPLGSDRACLPDHYGIYPCTCAYTHTHTHTSTFPFGHSARHSV